jgi:ferredoxin
MSKVRFAKIGLEVEVPVGTSILEAAKAAGAPEGDRCGGVCACSTCHVYVLKGEEGLSEPEDEELDILEKAFLPQHNSRLGCQAVIDEEGSYEVAITEESFEAFVDEHPDEREEAQALWDQRPAE